MLKKYRDDNEKGRRTLWPERSDCEKLNSKLYTIQTIQHKAGGSSKWLLLQVDETSLTALQTEVVLQYDSYILKHTHCIGSKITGLFVVVPSSWNTVIHLNTSHSNHPSFPPSKRQHSGILLYLPVYVYSLPHQLTILHLLRIHTTTIITLQQQANLKWLSL